MTGKNVTRVELCAAIYEKVPMSRSQSLVLVDTVLNEIINTLVKGERVKLSSFGSFIVRKKKQRMGRNPRTGADATISPRRVVVFKPSAILKQQINKRRSGKAQIAAHRRPRPDLQRRAEGPRSRLSKPLR
jgi:integration host factor subunit alpha